MVEAGRDLWNSSCPTVLLSRDHLKQVVQDHTLTAFQCPRTCQCSTKEHGLVGDIGARLTVGLDDLRGLFQP